MIELFSESIATSGHNYVRIEDATPAPTYSATAVPGSVVTLTLPTSARIAVRLIAMTGPARVAVGFANATA